MWYGKYGWSFSPPAHRASPRRIVMPAYILAIADITNIDKYNNEFKPAVQQAHATHGIKLLAQSDAPHKMLVGEPRANHVVILECQDEAQAHAFYESSEMQAAFAIAKECLANARIGIIPGATALQNAPAKEAAE